MPPVGAHQLRILTPTLLELTYITTKKPDPATVSEWNFVGAKGEPRLPNAKEFSVQVNDKSDAVNAVGFKRRVLYAPLKQRDLRVGNYLYLQLTTPISENQSVTVLNSDKKLWSANNTFCNQRRIRSAGTQRFTSTKLVIFLPNPKKQWSVSI